MAIFNWHIGSYQKGRATSQSNYIWRREEFSYLNDLVATGCGNLPPWCNGDPAVYFAAADLYERKNGSACRHLTLSLPRELTLRDWILLVEEYIARDLGPKPYQYAIHNVLAEGQGHPHAHILYSDRVSDGLERSADTFFRRANPKSPTLGGCKKDSGGQSPKQLSLGVITRKKLWEEGLNQALETAGHGARVHYQSGKWTPNI
ncbi:MobA/MobL family protein [Ramlibacter sp. AN1015]|uniref:MobA/MobL family protein n=1 Tax=Ramlibacter sp. AN1015 TaxID=3133428 RepID=UPI0030C4E0FC